MIPETTLLFPVFLHSYFAKGDVSPAQKCPGGLGPVEFEQDPMVADSAMSSIVFHRVQQ